MFGWNVWSRMDSIFPYVKNLNMFVCPSFRTKCNWDNYKNNLCLGYGYNYWLKNEDWLTADRHNGGLNFFFADGHAKYYKVGSGPYERINGAMNSG